MLLGLLWFVFGTHRLLWPWLLLPWFGFAVTAHFHGGVVAAGARSRLAIAWYEHGLARIADRWSGVRPRTTRVDASQSLYAGDLDLFSAGGLFELLATTRTSFGEDALAGWLLAPASLAVVAERQIAVMELRDRISLREALAALPGPQLIAPDETALTGWAELPQTVLPGALRWLAPSLAVLTIAAAIRWYTAGSPLLFLFAVAADACVTYAMQRPLRALLTGVENASAALTGLSGVMRVLEHEVFTAPLLVELQGQLRGTSPASTAVRRLATLATASSLRGNLLLRPLNVPLLYSVQLGLLLQAWKQGHGMQLRRWFRAIGELEALLSLSACAFEHPQDVFPELVPGEAIFDGQALGHPLLPADACVRNDVRLDGDTRLLLISGSNMSGKSTLLRSVGIATVMGLAGAPVRARGLRLGAFHVAASIQVNDSLQSGRSRFYAEILRLRAVCELARTQPPVLFLLDELLAGTNSNDRVAGATGVIRELLAADAFGLLSTHDLALAALPEPEAGLMRNAHFEDSVVEGVLRFDYTLRDGVVTRSNGLALMRMIGLHV